MAFRIDINGAHTPIADTGYETLREAIGGYIEFIRIPGGTAEAAGMYVDEEGLLKGLVPNTAASVLAGQLITGPVVVLTQAEVEADEV